MERCQFCRDRKHDQCEAVALYAYAWCECPCHTGEVADPLGIFLADLGVLDNGTVRPLLEDDGTT